MGAIRTSEKGSITCEGWADDGSDSPKRNEKSEGGGEGVQSQQVHQDDRRQRNVGRYGQPCEHEVKYAKQY